MRYLLLTFKNIGKFVRYHIVRGQLLLQFQERDMTAIGLKQRPLKHCQNILHLTLTDLMKPSASCLPEKAFQ